MFRASGGTASEYLERLEQRQRMECSHLAKARRNLNDMLSEAMRSSGKARKGKLVKAYAVWMDTNAWLATMGIETIAIPSELSETEAEYLSEGKPRTSLSSAPVALPGGGDE